MPAVHIISEDRKKTLIFVFHYQTSIIFLINCLKTKNVTKDVNIACFDLILVFVFF